MATNRDLLKEAIADAKTVKETAIANAKAALEESFGPFLREKLAAKLSEMEETDEELYEMEKEETKEAEEKKPMEEMGKSEEMEEEISLDELLAEISKEEELDETKKEEKLDEAKKEEELDEAKKEEEEMSIEDMSEDDLKSFIEDVIKDMVSAGELEAGHEGMENEEGAEEGEEEMEMGAEEGEEEELDEEINLDELLAEEEAEEETEEIQEGSFTGTLKGIAKAFNLFKQPAETVKEMEAKLKADPKLKDDEDFMAQLKILKKMAGVASAAGSFTSGGGSGEKQARLESKELEEAMKTIKTLQSELNEINLLNAKLLYTNKIFRNKSLTESQKVKVLTAFDKATTKQEAQLVYETLLESLKAPIAKTPIKESMSSASKVLGGTTSKPIIENDAFARMRELAFGNKK